MHNEEAASIRSEAISWPQKQKTPNGVDSRALSRVTVESSGAGLTLA